MPELRKTIKKKYIEGYEKLEFLYECIGCKYEYWANTKRLFMSCPKCRDRGQINKMRKAI